MSLIGNLFSRDKIVENAAKGIDKAFLTDQEKTEYFLKYLEATIPMNLSRRVIAAVVVFMWALFGIVGGALILTSHEKTAEFINFATVYVMPSFTVLTSFYFWRAIQKDKRK